MTNHKTNQIIRAVVLSSACLSAFTFFSSSVYADSSTTDTIRATVPVSCSFSSTVNHTYTATLDPGNLTTDIGSTTLTAKCNDSTGFGIYAVGYTADTYGTNSLQHEDRTLSQNDIATGLHTSG